ncbi:MAG: N-acetylmuramoyl-L-alanine amidase [Marinilabiliaceae bacterium]|nr:N-acetylmuramoyl-L-alanine amidase [Marinilabiliaceae bacterium]
MLLYYLKYISSICIVLLLCNDNVYSQVNDNINSTKKNVSNDIPKSSNSAKPIAGDGISSFLKRHGFEPSEYKKEFLELNKGHFGKDNQLLLHYSYTLPPKVSQTIVEPLFGEANKTVEITSSALKGATYYLVSGHGGPDPGAMSKLNGKDLCEDEYAYDIVLRLARLLMQHGAKVHIIIQDEDDGIRDDEILAMDDHETCLGEAIPLDQNKRLQQRSDAINKLYASERKGYCRALFLHLDSRSKKESIDVFFYHFKKSKLGIRLAENIRSKFEDKYKQHQPNRGFSGTISERNLFVLKESYPPCVFIELGNIQNVKDRVRFLKSSNREALAKWITEALIDDYKNR